MNLSDNTPYEELITSETASATLHDPAAIPGTDRSTSCTPPSIAKPGLPTLKLDTRHLAVATRNVRMMHLLERIASRFNEADVPLMALKGAALNLLLYRQPHERPMSDLDLMAPAKWISRARVILEDCGCHTGAPLVREDFFPRYYYETEYAFGEIFPTRIDLHARPLRPLRYARLMPIDALWDGAKMTSIGKATVLVPNDADMLIHLAAHAAVHGCAHGKWIEDIRRWIAVRGQRLNWERFLRNVAQWRLALPVRTTLNLIRDEITIPAHVDAGLKKMTVNWRDRLVLRHAPRDAEHTAAHVVVNAVCTPGWRFVLGYLAAIAFPGRAHMADWYPHRHWGWLACAHATRILRPPFVGLLNAVKGLFTKRASTTGEQSITKLTERDARRRGQ